MEPTQKYEAIISTLYLDAMYRHVTKKSRIGTPGQYILQRLFSSENLNEAKAAITLLKGIDEQIPFPFLRYQTVDAGYDYEPIYEQVHRMG